MTSTAPLSTFPAGNAQFSAERFVIGAGVAIFHIASGRVVICSAEERGRQYYFLPKGRRDAGEESGRGAEREGFEEVRSLFSACETLTDIRGA
jgi:8-oxo-dGTP pyrophosphatase MutT (NUDIX family)